MLTKEQLSKALRLRVQKIDELQNVRYARIPGFEQEIYQRELEIQVLTDIIEEQPYKLSELLGDNTEQFLNDFPKVTGKTKLSFMAPTNYPIVRYHIPKLPNFVFNATPTLRSSLFIDTDYVDVHMKTYWFNKFHFNAGYIGKEDVLLIQDIVGTFRI